MAKQTIEKEQNEKKQTKRKRTVNKLKNKKLVIVESPSKAKTINKYLGKEYVVTSCKGHLIDLPKSTLGVDIENNFEPKYITIRGKTKILNELKKMAKQSSEIILASDEDREGESIAYHLKNAFLKDNDSEKMKRITFHEITKNAILEAMNHPRDIDDTKVEAQKARRILDRIVGYKISPILWKKLKKGISAGRVQSAVLKMICDREEEIINFEPKKYFSIELLFEQDKKEYKADAVKYKQEKIDFFNEELVNQIMENVKDKDAIISNIIEQEKKRNPTAPYTTSKMQQDAAGRLNFNSAKTMSIAQSLYEGVDLGDERTGLITYMRTDSVRVSDTALNEVRQFIKDSYGDKYLPETPKIYKSKKSSQDAHEAIRPTSVFRTPEKVKDYLSKDEFKLYKLIWEKFVSSQMTQAISVLTKVEITVGDTLFQINFTKLKFDGFIKALKFLKPEEAKQKFPDLRKDQKLDIKSIESIEHFTQPPPRYSDASIIKAMEESGIGRPSTYAPTIMTLLKRYYIQRKQKQLYPTILGSKVNEMLIEFFPKIVDANFTGFMEDELDMVEEKKIEWLKILKDFYPDFKKTLLHAEENMKEEKNFLDEETDEVCEKCGGKMVKKLGRYGYFLACSNFPECRNTKSISLGKCPKCDGEIVERKSLKRRQVFYGCTKYPTCDFVTWNEPSDKLCPKCGKTLFLPKTKKDNYKYICLNEECGYKEE